MAFWKEKSEPLRKNRWTIRFGRAGLGSYNFALKKCDRPSYKTTDITHKFGNNNFYYPGRVEWNAINITFASFPDLEVEFMKILKDAGFNAPVDANNALKSASKISFTSAINSIDIDQITYKGTVIETWSLVNPFFTNIKFGDLSYDSEEVVDLECTIRYDTAILSAPTGGALTEES